MSLVRNPKIRLENDQQADLMAAMHRAADAAASVTMTNFRSDMRVENKAGLSNFDPVTQADRQAELAIRDSLQRDFPDIGFFGEEHDSVQGTSGLTWVVDPIDGTRAFMSGMPLWGTLIGLFDGQDAILGLMDQPFTQERFCAAEQVSTLISSSDSRVLNTRSGVELSEATLYCTTPDIFSDVHSRAAFERVKDRVRLARYGGDCYAYALLAAGYVDVVLDCDLKPYDIVALIPLIESAGGVVSTWGGLSAVDGGLVVACGSAQLHEQTIALLQG